MRPTVSVMFLLSILTIMIVGLGGTLYSAVSGAIVIFGLITEQI